MIKPRGEGMLKAKIGQKTRPFVPVSQVGNVKEKVMEGNSSSPQMDT